MIELHLVFQSFSSVFMKRVFASNNGGRGAAGTNNNNSVKRRRIQSTTPPEPRLRETGDAEERRLVDQQWRSITDHSLRLGWDVPTPVAKEKGRARPTLPAIRRPSTATFPSGSTRRGTGRGITAASLETSFCGRCCWFCCSWCCSLGTGSFLPSFPEFAQFFTLPKLRST